MKSTGAQNKETVMVTEVRGLRVGERVAILRHTAPGVDVFVVDALVRRVGKESAVVSMNGQDLWYAFPGIQKGYRGSCKWLQNTRLFHYVA